MADPRESLGRLVHDTRLAAEADRAAAEGREKFKLGTWEERDDWQRELDMRIGAAIAAAERERIAAMADRNGAVCTGDEGTSCYFSELIRTGDHDT